MTLITTSLDFKDKQIALQLAEQYNWQYVERSEINNLEDVTEKIIIVEKNRLSLRQGKHLLFFHPGISILRINNLQAGQKDRFVEACLLERGDSILDCTLGLASDAIVAAFIVGTTGNVAGIEAIPEISLITRIGLENFTHENDTISNAARKITVIEGNAQGYLQDTATEEFDCIYFDPMFKNPNLASSGMNMLRPFAHKQEITKEVIALALTRAKKCVVVKEMSRGILEELKPDQILGGKNTKIFYARWNK